MFVRGRGFHLQWLSCTTLTSMKLELVLQITLLFCLHVSVATLLSSSGGSELLYWAFLWQKE